MKSPPTKLPIGAVLPALNSRAYLPAHLAAVRDWAELVEEIVVVDSFSDDGTFEILKEQLGLPNVRFLSHPRGLYQSWNFGISQIRSKYTYISTVGDEITRDGLQHLIAVAEQFQADVTLSPPRFVNPDGRMLQNWRWPIHDFLEWQSIERPTAISSIHAFLMSALAMPEGIMGSSASNLYRTDSLQRRPFPTGYGHAGDTAWSLQHALQIKFAVTPSVMSQFLVHPKNSAMTEEEGMRLTRRFFDLALEVCRASDSGRLLSSLEAWHAETAELSVRQRLYTRARKHPFPWILNPFAWRLRARRNKQRQVVAQIKPQLRKRFGLQPRRTGP